MRGCVREENVCVREGAREGVRGCVCEGVLERGVVSKRVCW